MVHDSNKLQTSVIISEVSTHTPVPASVGYASMHVRENRSEAISDLNRMTAAYEKKFGTKCEGRIDDLPGRKFIARIIPV